MRLLLPNGDTVEAESFDKMVLILKDRHPMRHEQSVEDYIGDTLLAIRGTGRIVERVHPQQTPESFLRLYIRAFGGRLIDGGGGLTVSTQAAAKPGVSGLGFAGIDTTVGSPPADPRKWGPMGHALAVTVHDGRTYQLVHTATGWSAGVGYGGVASHWLAATGATVARTLDTAPRFASPVEAAQAARKHYALSSGR